VTHPWQIVKNSQPGGHRPVVAFREEVNAALADFESGETLPGTSRPYQRFEFHGTVREALGLGDEEQVVALGSLFSNPYPFLHGHGTYVCGLLSTPTRMEDGLAEFTSLFLVASTKQLLTVILDPPTTYAGPFGQRLLNRHEAHLAGSSDDVGATLLMIIRDNVTSLNIALRELVFDVEHVDSVLHRFGEDRRRDDFEALQRIESHLTGMKIEVDSLDAVLTATAHLVEMISTDKIDVTGPVQLFDRRHEITAEMLSLQARQTASVRDRLDEKIAVLSASCEALRDQFFVEATHRIGAIAALLLLPTFIVGLYGQNFDFPERHWSQGYIFSWSLIIGSTVALFAIFKRRKWL